MIPFNKPFIIGKELEYIQDSVASGKISGDGKYTILCQKFLEQRFGFKKTLLTTSCTDALEMCALLLDIKEGDEVIVPSYAFVSAANAFLLRGAKIVFADVHPSTMNIETHGLEELITPKTKAIVIIHYAGIACKMDEIMELVEKHKITLIEDAALAFDSYYLKKPLGSFGHLAAFSFHETKVVMSGEGGALVINDERYIERAEIIREKGTNRSKFFRGETDKYNWLDLGSSFLPSDITAAYLYAQLEQMDKIIEQRKFLWEKYYNNLLPLEKAKKFLLPWVPDEVKINGQLFYLLCKSEDERNALMDHLHSNGIKAVFHYLPLHTSPYFKNKHDHRLLPVSTHSSQIILRLPLFYEMTTEQHDFIVEQIFKFYNQ